MDAQFLERLRALNALVLGWALALLGVTLNVLWGLDGGSAGFVIGAAVSVLAIACAYFSEIAYISDSDAIGAYLYLACAVTTATGLIVWFVAALVSA